MDRLLTIGLGVGLLYYGILRGAKALIVGIHSYALRGISIMNGTIDLTLNFIIKNPLFVGLTLRGIKGDIYIQGINVGGVNMQYDYFISGGHTHVIPVVATLQAMEIGSAALANIQSGNVQSLTIAFDGYIYISKYNVPVPVQVTLDWGDLQNGK